MDTFGSKFKVTIYGESHSPALGAVVEGVPSGIALKAADFAEDIARRAPEGIAGTSRRENDAPAVLSGVENGFTTGEPIRVEFANRDTRPADYSPFTDIPRPGHADYTALVKESGRSYAEALREGFTVPSGGGHFSGRMTLPVVAAGTIAKTLLPGVCIEASLTEVGGCPDKNRWTALLEKAAREGDSLGGVVECKVCGLRAGLGEPFWDSVESLVSHAIFSIPGVRGIEFGDGFAASRLKGSEHNDPLGPEGPVKNGAGGVNGGITNGAPLLLRVAFKPTSSIAKAQKTWNYRLCEEDTLEIRGRHDVCFALRTPVIVEAMCAIVLADLISRSQR